MSSKERISYLDDEKRAMEALVRTLINQNKEILIELDTHVEAHEDVRSKLDRKGEVAGLMDTFNRELMGSKLELERGRSPMRQSQHSPLRMSLSSNMYQHY